MIVEKELFAIPDGEDFILYAPLRRFAFRVGTDVINSIANVQQGKRAGFDKTTRRILSNSGILRSGREEPEEKPKTSKPFSPVSTILVNTFDCNLRCVYCYMNGGEGMSAKTEKKGEEKEVMSQEIARASVDFIIENAKRTEARKTLLTFHGGEPFLPKCMPMVMDTAAYFRGKAKEEGLSCRVEAETSGFFSPKTLDWIANNVDRIQISIDGAAEVQDTQRPLCNGGGTFEVVSRNIKEFERRKFDYLLRATVSKESVDKIPETVKTFLALSTQKSFHLEPIVQCGRCRTTNASTPDPKVYVQKFIEAQEEAAKQGVTLYYSGARPMTIGEDFCGASGRNFFVTPKGKVTTCLDLCREEEPGANIFFIGEYKPETKRFKFDDKRIAALRERTVSNMPYCNDCFAKYNCSGDCPARVFFQSGDIADPSNNGRCEINRTLLKHQLKKALEVAEGVR